MADIHGTSVQQEREFGFPPKVEKYAENMKEGDVFPLPYLDYADNLQEGRHRALAFEKAFGEYKEFPVMVITEYEGDMSYPDGDIRNKYIN